MNCDLPPADPADIIVKCVCGSITEILGVSRSLSIQVRDYDTLSNANAIDEEGVPVTATWLVEPGEANAAEQSNG